MKSADRSSSSGAAAAAAEVAVKAAAAVAVPPVPSAPAAAMAAAAAPKAAPPSAGMAGPRLLHNSKHVTELMPSFAMKVHTDPDWLWGYQSDRTHSPAGMHGR